MDNDFLNDTICAVATAAGNAGVGIVRISGKESLKMLSSVFLRKDGKSDYLPGMMYYGLVSAGGTKDAALAVYFAAPHSFTGEDTAELHCHGSPVLLDEVVRELLDSGARHAAAGEFTRRAFINGKLDLSESEGLIDIINAESRAALAAAASLHRGELSRTIREIQQHIKHSLAHIEVTIDYCEEGVEEVTTGQVKQMLDSIIPRLTALKQSFASGRLLREGINVAICGIPNTGKSSLLNAMLGFERAIVTDVPGTTRDSIDAEYRHRGMRFKLVDTAGLRDSLDIVESMGIERAKEAVRGADAVIYVVPIEPRLSPKQMQSVSPQADLKQSGCDVLNEQNVQQCHIAVTKNEQNVQQCHIAVTKEDKSYTEIRQLCKDKPLFLVLSKADLRFTNKHQETLQKQSNSDKIETAKDTIKVDSQHINNSQNQQVGDFSGCIEVSAHTGYNIDRLKDMLYEHLAPKLQPGGDVLTNRRHYDAVCRALKESQECRYAADSRYLDMTAYSLKQIYSILGEITGESSVEDIIDLIFSRFCVGK